MRLSLRNVTKTYSSGKRALDDVSLEIGVGVFGLLGPNGAGKTTLMRIIATLQSADEGVVSFDGIDATHDVQSLRRVLGYLPQEYGLYPEMTAEDLLDHLAILKGLHVPRARRETVSALLEKVNLHQARKQKLGTFSGGMKQRFGIAQALLGEPRLIIVDEPTAGLDPAERLRFNNLLCAIGQERVVVLSTHIVEDIADLCLSMAILCEGRIKASGVPSVLIRSLEGRLWKRVVSPAELHRYANDLDVIATRLLGGRTVIHVVSDDRPDPAFDRADASLEDLYFSILPARFAEA